MKDGLRILVQFIVIIVRISQPGSVKAIAAENMLLRQQLINLGRDRKRSPKLSLGDRILYGLLASWIDPKRLLRLAIIVKPSTLLRFHKALVARKYRLLFSPKSKGNSVRKGQARS